MSSVQAKAEKSSVNKLQEIFQIWKLPLPVYQEAEGTYQEFGTVVTINIEGDISGFHALGRTKKASKTLAAERALAYIEKDFPHLMEPPPLPEYDGAAAPPMQILKKPNKQKEAAVDQDELARETEKLGHIAIGLDMARLIQQSRVKAKLSQKELATRINEKVQIVSEYEQGKAIPNKQVIGKLERALGVYLTGARAGEDRSFKH